MNRAGKAQSTVEYLLIFSVIVAALLAMQVYIKRGMQGRMKAYAEQLGGVSGYSPGATNSNYTITKDIDEAASSFTEDNIGTAQRAKISESSTQINQTVSRSENLLSFTDEPGRMR